MKNKLSQEYKDDLYEKVLEKKRIRTIRRKKMLSIFIVFVSVVGFTTLGFSLKGQDNYHNFFTSETENIIIEDEYQYFDDLGIKLEFINIDDNYLTLGINIKYEDIAEYKGVFGCVEIIDENGNLLMKDDLLNIDNNFNYSNKFKDKKINNSSEILYIYTYLTDININKCYIKIIDFNINDGKKIEFEYEKEISIEE